MRALAVFGRSSDPCAGTRLFAESRVKGTLPLSADWCEGGPSDGSEGFVLVPFALRFGFIVCSCFFLIVRRGSTEFVVVVDINN